MTTVCPLQGFPSEWSKNFYLTPELNFAGVSAMPEEQSCPSEVCWVLPSRHGAASIHQENRSSRLKAQCETPLDSSNFI